MYTTWFFSYKQGCTQCRVAVGALKCSGSADKQIKLTFQCYYATNSHHHSKRAKCSETQRCSSLHSIRGVKSACGEHFHCLDFLLRSLHHVWILAPQMWVCRRWAVVTPPLPSVPSQPPGFSQMNLTFLLIPEGVRTASSSASPLWQGFPRDNKLTTPFS